MGQTLAAYILLVRDDLDDYVASNRLLGLEEEFTEPNVDRACDRALETFNTSPPLIGTYTFETFPSDNLFIDMAIYALLKRSTYKRGRNDLTYSESGNSINDQNFAQYQALKQELKEDTQAQTTRLKMALNLSKALADTNSNAGGVSSPYKDL